MYRTPTACKHRVSGSFSLPSRGPFHLSFTVLCAIGHWVVFSLGGWSPRLPARFHVSRSTPDPARSMTFSPTGLSPSLAGLPRPFRYIYVLSQLRGSSPCGPTTPLEVVWAPPRSLAATYGITVVFSSSPYLDVSVQEVPGCTLWIHVQSLQVFCSRFPHSEIRGSQDICSYPRLIAACHVFHRLPVPRHPPYALSV